MRSAPKKRAAAGRNVRHTKPHMPHLGWDIVRRKKVSPPSKYSELADLVRITRTHKGLTLRDLEAEIRRRSPKAGVTYVTISRLESGKVKPRFKTLRAVAKALGLEPEVLFHAAAGV